MTTHIVADDTLGIISRPHVGSGASPLMEGTLDSSFVSRNLQSIVEVKEVTLAPLVSESVFRQRRGEVQLRLSAGVRREAGLRTAREALQALQRSQHQFGVGLLQGASGSTRWRGRLVRRSAVGEGRVLVQRGRREGS